MDIQNVRPIKVLLPGSLVDRVDEALQLGLGGFRTRHKLLEEAINYYLEELESAQRKPSPKYIAKGTEERESYAIPPESVVDPKASDDKIVSTPPALAAIVGRQELLDFVPNSPVLDEISIAGASGDFFVSAKDDVSTPHKGPILGLHNRDWPSLHALDLLGRMTVNGVVSCKDYYLTATANGWKIAHLLSKTQNPGIGKLTALLPSNQRKAQAAEDNYQNFALGWISKTQERTSVPVSGPLFVWSCASLVWRDEELHIGLTKAGAALLNAMAGLDPFAPHDQKYSLAFLDHLAHFGEGDWAFFHQLLTQVSKRPTRRELVADVKQHQDSTNSVASTLVQGYVARGREWGLIEARMHDGQYKLTDFGTSCLAMTPS